jgi:hypothetical protein
MLVFQRRELGSSESGGQLPFLVRPLFTSLEKGIKNQLWASVSKDYVNGEYYEPVGVGGKAIPDGKDDKLAKKLWDWTEKELQGHSA